MAKADAWRRQTRGEGKRVAKADTWRTHAIRPLSQIPKRRGDRYDRPVVQGEDRDRGDPVSRRPQGERERRHTPFRPDMLQRYVGIDMTII